MKLLEALEQTAHLAVGVVHRLDRPLDRMQGMLAQLDDHQRLSISKQGLDEIGRVVDAPRSTPSSMAWENWSQSTQRLWGGSDSGTR